MAQNLEILSTPDLEKMWQQARDPRFARRIQEEIEDRQRRVSTAKGTGDLFARIPHPASRISDHASRP